jgi:hypothetical protein
MRFRITLVVCVSVLFLFLHPLIASEAKAPPLIVWLAESPECFDPDADFGAQMMTTPQFSVGGSYSRPQQVSSEMPSDDEIEATGEEASVMVYEIVINTQGKTESVVSLRRYAPKTEILVANYVKDWEWKPSTIDGVPTCIRFMVTPRVNKK